MKDLSITRDGELMVAQVESETDRGTEFLDAYMPPDPETEYTVVDSGRIIVPEDALGDVVTAARERGLTLEETRRW